jgi:RimJ/RimL family protein N-acetyltransferase
MGGIGGDGKFHAPAPELAPCSRFSHGAIKITLRLALFTMIWVYHFSGGSAVNESLLPRSACKLERTAVNSPCPPVLLRLARPEDVPGIIACWEEHGEAAVDIRSSGVVTFSILENRVLVLESERKIVGTASFFDRGHSIEMGGLTLAPQFRRRGLAQLMAIARLIIILPGYDNLPILSEVYPSSLKSLRYLFRLGFQPLDRVPMAFHEVAWQANNERAVIYMVADPVYYQTFCYKFEGIARDGQVFGSAGSANVTVSDEFDGHLILLRNAQKPEYAEEAFDNRHSVGGGRNLSRWLARHCGMECISRTQFLIDSGLQPDSWGHPEEELGVLSEQFIRSLQDAAIS